MVRAMLRARQVTERFWPLALNTAIYLKNRTPHHAINGEAPICQAFGRKNVNELQKSRVFGCRAFVSIPKYLRKGKGSDVRWNGVMVGYSTKSPEFLIYDPTSHRIRTAYSVIFQEDVCGFTNKRKSNYHEKPVRSPLRIMDDAVSQNNMEAATPNGENSQDMNEESSDNISAETTNGELKHNEIESQERYEQDATLSKMISMNLSI